MNIQTIKGKIVVKELEKWNNDIPTHQVARIIFNDNKALFSSFEEVRSSVRYYRGQMGKTNRKMIKKYGLDNYTMIKLPKSMAKELSVFTLPTECNNILFLSDIHIPFHHEESLEIALDYGKEKVNTIYLNGDVMDMFQVSSHEKDPNKVGIETEFELTKEFLAYLRQEFPKATIYWKEGNHERRWKRWLRQKAPEVLRMKEFELNIILELHKYGITWIENETLVKFGKLNVIHGNEFRGGGGVNPARSLFMRAKSNTIAGDKHKTGENNEGTLNEDLITTWSVGCLCELNPEYLPFAHTIWNHGFAHITTESNGNFSVKNFRIYRGKIL